MSETQEQPTGIAWGDPIAPERLAKLKEMFERQRVWAENENRDIAQSVFNRVELTGADVFWLMAIAISTPDDDLDAVAIKLRAPRSPSVAWDSTLGTLPSLDLQGIRLFNAQLQDAKLPTAHLEDAYLSWAHLQGADLGRAFLEGANLSGAHLEGATLSWAQLRRANLEGAHLEGAHFDMACLEDANLSEADLQAAKLDIAQMRNVNLRKTRLEGANLSSAWLERADLTGAAFDRTSRLYNTFLIDACLDQVAFNNVHLGEVVWGRTEQLGEERVAREARINDDKGWRYRVAGRAYRALSLALRNQGAREYAIHFHYRAEVMERKADFWQMFFLLRTPYFYEAPKAFGRWLFSWLLGALAGYGIHIWRILVTYLLVVSAFAGLMLFASGRVVSFDSIRDVFVLSITSFHGRGVQPPGLHLTDALATLSAAEAIFGLFIESIIIAAFTRRVIGN